MRGSIIAHGVRSSMNCETLKLASDSVYRLIVDTIPSAVVVANNAATTMSRIVPNI